MVNFLSMICLFGLGAQFITIYTHMPAPYGQVWFAAWALTSVSALATNRLMKEER